MPTSDLREKRRYWNINEKSEGGIINPNLIFRWHPWTHCVYNNNNNAIKFKGMSIVLEAECNTRINKGKTKEMEWSQVKE